MTSRPGHRRLDGAAKKPCRFFKMGKCLFGTNCRYSHEATDHQAPNPQENLSWRQGGTGGRCSPDQDLLRSWKSLLYRGEDAPNDHASRCFFQRACELMDGDIGASQETVRQLAQEEGLAFIRNVTGYHVASPDASELDVWTGQVQPLFRVLTHQRVVDSAVLEQEVAQIYNFMVGIGGRRMETLFDFVITVLDLLTGKAKAQAVELSLAVLSQMLECNTSNMVNDRFGPIVKRLSAIVELEADAENEFFMRQSRKYVLYMQRRLGVGDAMASNVAAPQAVVSRAEFVLRRDLPGRLSPEGPRHDNDHSHITDISIMPTFQEIVSVRAEYLPTNDASQFHLPGIQGRLDREFRLLREDTVGQLGDAVRAHLDTMPGSKRTGRLGADKDGLRTHTYYDAKIAEVAMYKNSGLDLLVDFRQPAPASELRLRRDWWIGSKRLQPGGLVCLISGTDSILFCVVANNTVVGSDQKLKWQKQDEKDDSAKDAPSLADDKHTASVHLNIAEPGRTNVMQALGWYRPIGHRAPLYIVEFSGVLLASYKYTLEALKEMARRPNIPFTELIAPSEPVPAEPSAPEYAARPGFSFDLACLTDGTELLTSTREPLAPDDLANHSDLDQTQASALLNTLSTGLALIQGPPGTGKSFTGEKIIKVLLSNKKAAQLGPILCVCYTNHALDQLLEHLLDDDARQIIRIGSRSKSARLEEVNLHVVAQASERTKRERHALWQQETTLQSQVAALTGSLWNLETSDSGERLVRHLLEHHPRHHHAFFGPDEDGYEVVRHGRDGQLLDQWRKQGRKDGGEPRDIGFLLEAGVRELSNAERRRLFAHWKKEIRDPIISEVAGTHYEYLDAKSQRDRIRKDVDLRCLNDADIVGVTTTGLARSRDLLRKLRCKVMLCEEAGEVLEAHTLTALLPSVEHAILIGDHLQLRPQTQNYELQSTHARGGQYSLDVSLFERLVCPPHSKDRRLPYSTLETQRRMHPSISALIRSTLYPRLEDGGTVAAYPGVLGMKRRLFWMHHEKLEDNAAQATTTRTNAFEMDMTIALVQHLVRQGGYGPNDIAVITPYLGQLMGVRRRMERLFEITVSDRDLEDLEALEASAGVGVGAGAGAGAGAEAGAGAGAARPPPNIGSGAATVSKTTLLKSVRLATVDNFQGEEAKVVVCSLVRSNEQNKCGFLGTSNRINVLLSRAQHGMYLIGNAKTYGPVRMWADVLRLLEADGNVGPKLELQCTRHPDKPMLVSHPDDFLQFSPEGGCILACDRRLACGHACGQRCHAQVLHAAVKCFEACPRPKKGCDHPCRLVCGEACEPKCTERLTGLNMTLACGHKLSSAKCWEDQNPAQIRCGEIVAKVVPGCEHTVRVPCHIDVSDDQYRCGALCEALQPCGHPCRSECHRCRTRTDGTIVSEEHGICKQPCGRTYTTCRHDCIQACHGEAKCPPCTKPCEVRCSHSKCSKKCSEPCAPCAEQVCDSRCPHTQCTMPCAAPCDWVPCSLRCDERLECGHQCPSICGERCPGPEYCQSCCSDDIRTVMVDYIEGLEYHEVNLDQDPCVFPDCGHILTMTSLDGVMDMKAHYTMTDEKPTDIMKKSEPFSMDEVKVCPRCRGSLRNVARYGRIVRRAMLDEATKKFIACSNNEYLQLAGRLVTVQQQLADAPLRAPSNRGAQRQWGKGDARLKQLRLLSDLVLNPQRYQKAVELWKEIGAFADLVRTEEQPFQRVADFVLHAARQKREPAPGHFAFDESRLQVKGYLQASSLRLRCETVIYSDYMNVRDQRAVATKRPMFNFAEHFEDCGNLIHLARSTKHPRLEVEGHLYMASFCAFALGLHPETSTLSDEARKAANDAGERRRDEGKAHLNEAQALVDKYPSTSALAAEIEGVNRMLDGGVFYANVSADEMRAVYRAMAAEFSGTGHWYTCENGHPFTVGECGMPMQEATCPECGAGVGGRNHTPAAGVRRASEMEEIARQVDALQV